MHSKRKGGKGDLTVERAFFANRDAFAAYADLMDRVFDLDVVARDARLGPAPRSPDWTPFAFFDGTGRCVASVEAAVLDMILDGRPAALTGIRGVAVDPGWRGRGLSRDLMEDALAWCESAAEGPTLLFTGEEALYGRFGFRPVAQHAFEGPAPPRIARSAATRIDPHGDIGLVRRLLELRVPVSTRCALVGAISLVLANVASAEDLSLALTKGGGVLVAYEVDDETITLVDLIAGSIPPMDEILAALPARERVRTLFPPDRLGWTGTPTREDTGLMLRGPVPPAMKQPFMLPPTVEF